MADSIWDVIFGENRFEPNRDFDIFGYKDEYAPQVGTKSVPFYEQERQFKTLPQAQSLTEDPFRFHHYQPISTDSLSRHGNVSVPMTLQGIMQSGTGGLDALLDVGGSIPTTATEKPLEDIGVMDFNVYNAYKGQHAKQPFTEAVKEANLFAMPRETEQKMREYSGASDLFKFGGNIASGGLAFKTLTNKVFSDAVNFGVPGLTFDLEDPNFGQIFQELGADNEFVNWLAGDGKNETAQARVEQRLKNALTETGLGYLVEQGVRIVRNAKELIKNPEYRDKVIDETLQPLVDQRSPTERINESLYNITALNNDNRHLVNVAPSPGIKMGDDQPTRELAPVDEGGYFMKSAQVLMDDPREVYKQPSQLAQINKKGQLTGELVKAGVTAQELQETGLLKFLTEAQKSGETLTKEQILLHISRNRPFLNPIRYEYGDAYEDTADDWIFDEMPQGGTRYGNVSVDDDIANYDYRADEITDEILYGDSYYLPQVLDNLHKKDPIKYPKTPEMRVRELENINLKAELEGIQRNLEIPFNDLLGDDNEDARRFFATFYKKYIDTDNTDGVTATEWNKPQGFRKLYNKTKEFVEQRQKTIDDFYASKKQEGLFGIETEDWVQETKRKIDEGDGQDLPFDLDEEAFEIAEQEYMDNPYYVWDLPEGYHAYGNEDGGITVRDPYDDEVGVYYSISDAQVETRQHALDHGYLDYGSDGTSWHDYISPHEEHVRDLNYEEIPVVVDQRGFKYPDKVDYHDLGGGDIQDDYLFHIRKTDRYDIDGNKYFFMEETQSDLQQAARQFGVTKEDAYKKAELQGQRKVNITDALTENHKKLDDLEINNIYDEPIKEYIEKNPTLKQHKKEIEDYWRNNMRGYLGLSYTDEVKGITSYINDFLDKKFHSPNERSYAVGVGKKRKYLDEMRFEEDFPPNVALFLKNLYKDIDKYYNDKTEIAKQIRLLNRQQDSIDAWFNNAPTVRDWENVEPGNVFSGIGGTKPPLSNDKWIETSIKTAIKSALDSGYDRVAWSNARQVADLWSERFSTLYENTYDKKMPKFAKKYVEKLGGKVEKKKLKFGDEEEEVWTIEITPEMKKNLKSTNRRQDYRQPLYAIPPTVGLFGMEQQDSDKMNKKQGLLQ